MLPRSLVLLRIDDRTPARPPRIPSSASANVDRPPASVDLAQFGPPDRPFIAINRWLNAIRYWAEYTGQRPPDIVVGDVRFNEDDSTPLNFYTASPDVPTGLSHIKPFAAVARAYGLPIGISIHTADPGLFERMASGDTPERRMGLLAAHDIGELAAILGEPLELDGRTPEEQLGACWTWLLRRTEVEFIPAFRKAVADYRRRLVLLASGEGTWPPRKGSIYVRPADWARLAQWCERMRSSPMGLNESDPGLLFYTGDGRCECLSLRSLYADVGACDLGTVALPPECFELVNVPEPWALDANGLPRIGALLNALGASVADAYGRAVDVIRLFDLPLEPGTRLEKSLVDMLPDKKLHAVERTIAVFIQLVRMYHENWCQWKEYCTELTWIPETLSFGHPGDPTLTATLEKIVRLMREEDWFYPGDVRAAAELVSPDSGLAKANDKAIAWHCQLLVKAGVFETDGSHDPGGRHRYTYHYTGKKFEHVLLPDAGPIPEGADAIVQYRQKFLKETLGFSGEYGPNASDADRTLARCIAGGLDLESDGVAETTGFIERFHHGNGPQWLVQLCQDYAEQELKWTDRETWPKALRPARHD